MDDIDVIIASYLTGNASVEEMKYLREWLSKDEANMKYFQNKREVWVATSSARFNSQNAFSRFQRKVHKSNDARKRLFFKYAAAACAAAACLALAVFFSFNRGVDSVNSSTELAEVSVSAPAGSTTSVELPDGTIVTLNACSRISYCQSYGITERTIKLSGEALFDVKHDDAMPMVVNVDGASIRDIGTKFNINAHDNNDFISVSLLEGSAEVHNMLGDGREHAILKPNQKAEISKEAGHMKVTKQSSLSPADWVNGSVTFENSTLMTIANELSRKYNVHVMIADDTLKSTRFYCCFAGDTFTLHDILMSLEATGKVKCKEEGSTIIFM